jgi:hypothetical protein
MYQQTRAGKSSPNIQGPANNASEWKKNNKKKEDQKEMVMKSHQKPLRRMTLKAKKIL